MFARTVAALVDPGRLAVGSVGEIVACFDPELARLGQGIGRALVGRGAGVADVATAVGRGVLVDVHAPSQATHSTRTAAIAGGFAWQRILAFLPELAALYLITCGKSAMCAPGV